LCDEVDTLLANLHVTIEVQKLMEDTVGDALKAGSVRLAGEIGILVVEKEVGDHSQ
jgi:hypothetical protein